MNEVQWDEFEFQQCIWTANRLSNYTSDRKKKFGCDVDVQISDLQLYETADDKHVCLSANFKLSIVKNDVDKLVNMV